MVTKQERKTVLMAENEIREQTPNLNRIELALSMIDAAKIDTSELSNAEIQKQKTELEKRKIEARELIEDFLRSAREYFDVVIQMVNFTRSSSRFAMDEWKYRDRMMDIDQRRRACHNALADSLAIALRHIRLNFGELPDEALEQFEEEVRKRKRMVLDVIRKPFPKKIFCPDNVDIENRNSIADWAEKLAEEMKLRDLSARPKKEKDRG